MVCVGYTRCRASTRASTDCHVVPASALHTCPRTLTPSCPPLQCGRPPSSWAVAMHPVAAAPCTSATTPHPATSLAPSSRTCPAQSLHDDLLNPCCTPTFCFIRPVIQLAAGVPHFASAQHETHPLIRCFCGMQHASSLIFALSSLVSCAGPWRLFSSPFLGEFPIGAIVSFV